MMIERSGLWRISKPYFTFVVLFTALAVLVWPTAWGIVDRWFKFTEAYSHGLLMLAVSMFLVVRAARLKPVSPGFYPLWLVPFALALTAYGLGEIMRVQALSELTIVPLMLGGAAVLLGWQQVRQFIIPVGILFLAVPVWDYLSWTLQIITVEINRLLLGLFGIDFRVEGIFVYLTDVGIFEVAHGCSGLRYLLVGQALALLYGELNLQKISSRVWIYLVAVCLALVANWIRVFVIIYVGHETDMQSSLINEHDNFGWLVFAGTLVPLFFIGRVLEKEESATSFNSHSNDESFVGAGGRGRSGQNPLLAALAIVVLVIFTWLTIPAEPTLARTKNTVSHSASLVSENRWLPLFGKSLAGWNPAIKRPDRIMERSYTFRKGLSKTGESSAELFLGLYSYDSQRAGHELVHYNNRLYDSSNYIVENVFDIESVEGRPMSGMTLKQRGTDILINLIFGYYVEGRWEDNELEAKLAQLPGVLNKRTDASLLVIGLQCVECDARERLSEISTRILPKAQDYLDQLYESEPK
jgi:exosortase